ncbi:MAG TPA: MFS transporter [Pseudomonadales bacterium]|nr:MFS transporter [Pseudomonadales bacterium]
MTRLAPNGLAARIVLAILVAVGILYANFGPLIVSGLAHHDFTSAGAGYLLSVNLYGTALGGMLIVFFVRRVPWRVAGAVLMLVVLATDIGSLWLSDPQTLQIVRFAHGVAGGASMGIFGSVIARTTSPERTFALTIVIQLVLGGLATALLAPIVVASGVAVIWICLIVFTTVGLVLLPWLDAYPAREPDPTNDSGEVRRGPWVAIALGCVALFAYQAGQMSTFAYVIELGERHRLGADFVGTTVAIGQWVGGPAGLFVAWWSTRSGRLLPGAIGALLTSASSAFFLAPGEFAFFVANVGLGVFFTVTIPYLLGVVAEMDNSGQIAALGGFVSSLGLATGPAIAATVLGDQQYDRVVLFAVIALATTAVAVLSPARTLDRRDKHGRVVW